jgi:two-component system response regulator
MTDGVLIVDDSPEFLGVARRLLEQLRPGVTVHTMQSGTDALAFLTRGAPYGDARRPAFVVLDFRLPDMNAPEVLARLRGEPQLADLPILVLSQAGWPEDARRALAAGASAFVVKPSRASTLRRVLQDFWSRHAD